MRRRDFMAGSAATAALGVAGWPVYAEINAGSPVPKRIAVVHSSTTRDQLTGSAYPAYFRELDRLGYVEGKNLVVEWYSVLGRHDRTEEIARAVVASRPDLIFPNSTALALALKPLTAAISILALTGDPVASGIVTSLAKPGGNITGVSVDVGLGIYGKRFQFLFETAPRVANVRFLMTTTSRWCGKRRLATCYVTLQAGPVFPSTLHWSAALSIKLHMSRFSRRWRETALTVLSSMMQQIT
jgi:putative tryptophan/tyrosine transport system substrate-binding protein